MRQLLISGCLLAVGSMLWAQADEAKLRDAMKQIGPTAGAMNKKIAAMDAGATEDAKKLSSLFSGDVHSFWEGRKVEDAMTYAKAAGDGFAGVAKLTADAKWDEAAALAKKTGANCAGCHKQHREKAEGGWTIK